MSLKNSQATLATPEQIRQEQMSLRIIQRPEVRAARERAREKMLQDPIARTKDGFLGLDRALDLWSMAITMRCLSDINNPNFIWIYDNTPRTWAGHTWPGAAVFIDTPDNIARDTIIDGDASYEVYGRFGENPTQFTLQLMAGEEHHSGYGRPIDVLFTQKIVTNPDGSFIVTVDNKPANGRPNHLQSESGTLWMVARDGHRSWTCSPTELSVRRLTPPASQHVRSEDEIAQETATCLESYVEFWSKFKDTFLGPPPVHGLSGPNEREGGWGFVASGRFNLEDDQAIIITTDHAGAGYVTMHIADPWGLTTDPVFHTVTRNNGQVVPDEDGLYTHVVSALDPGVANWMNTAGLNQGYYLMRWQAFANGRTVEPDQFVREIKVVNIDELEAHLRPGVARADANFRRDEMVRRAREHAGRLK